MRATIGAHGYDGLKMPSKRQRAEVDKD